MEGTKAEVILAAYKCIQAAFRMLKPGNKNSQVTEKISEICGDYGVNPVAGVLSHELQKNLIDESFCILNKLEIGEHEVEEKEFGVN